MPTLIASYCSDPAVERHSEPQCELRDMIKCVPGERKGWQGMSAMSNQDIYSIV